MHTRENQILINVRKMDCVWVASKTVWPLLHVGHTWAL